jgi:hypothetical protein
MKGFDQPMNTCTGQPQQGLDIIKAVVTEHDAHGGPRGRRAADG